MKLRNYQEPIADLLFDYLIKHPGKHPLISLPTGSGKTVVLSDIIQKTLANWPDTKIMVLSHVKEIVKQDYDTLCNFIDPEIIGINSSGLGRREIKQVTIANIQSVYRRIDDFKEFKFVIIDEAHLIPITGNGMYQRFLGALNAVYLGLTATKFRLGTGYIFGQDDTIFDDLIYDLTEMDHFNQLIKDGYLSKLKTLSTDYKHNTDTLHIQGGEFIEKEMANAFDRESITDIALSETIEKAGDRKKWLVFAIDIDHAEHIAEALIRKGITANIVHSKMEDDRDRVIRKFKSGSFTALVNVNVLTTGFDSPDIDLIVLLRPTLSPVLHVQMIGRGLRIAEGKEDCLVLDFAGNTERLGPINDVQVYRRRKTGETGEPITKECPQCKAIHHPKAKFCEFCGHEFKFLQRISTNTSTAEVVAKSKLQWVSVTSVEYAKHSKRNSPPSVKVSYNCGLRKFNEWVCLDHNGYAKYIAKHWVEKRGGKDVDSTDELLEIANDLKAPYQILIDRRGKYPIVADYKFN